MLFQNEQTREILIQCSTFILYVDYVQSPILPYRDVFTVNEVRLSLLQADRYNKQVLDLLNFFFFGSSLLHIRKSNIYTVAGNHQVV